jgi:hypothetical protein
VLALSLAEEIGLRLAGSARYSKLMPVSSDAVAM